MAEKSNGFYIKIGIYLAAIVFAAGAFYVLTNFRLEAAEEKGKKNEEIAVLAAAEFDIVEDAVNIIQYDIRHIKAQMTEQKEIQAQRHQEILTELRT